MIESMEFDAAVAVGIAAFCAGQEPPSDDEVWERLTAAGVEPWLVESFAGHGTTWRDAIGEAVSTFSLGALHPIIGALLRPGAAPDQIERERYEHPNGPFELMLGAQLNSFTDRPVPAAGPLLHELLEALRAAPLTPGVHWLRLFTAYRDGQLQTNEVLLDSEPWPGGEAAAANSQAPLPDGMVAVRIFGLLVPFDNALMPSTTVSQ